MKIRVNGWILLLVEIVMVVIISLTMGIAMIIMRIPLNDYTLHIGLVFIGGGFFIGVGSTALSWMYDVSDHESSANTEVSSD